MAYNEDVSYCGRIFFQQLFLWISLHDSAGETWLATLLYSICWCWSAESNGWHIMEKAQWWRSQHHFSSRLSPFAILTGFTTTSFAHLRWRATSCCGDNAICNIKFGCQAKADCALININIVWQHDLLVKGTSRYGETCLCNYLEMSLKITVE